ncbi:AraC family transcriptional regulator [Fictibacillus fluitans]|uniref:Helix-turn-helix domain-containing protein n=1 Tax=Fictibacillus fluitans TaxID=3058422 RepID=A0ABT8HZX6_9BACL|nr:helix-turn-helix domain-containing protein [Fictibacillus sp. NE201]MDN4526342.1 helix-turn-helix domain-containing protein [Fictibacillus sp. NE201]
MSRHLYTLFQPIQGYGRVAFYHYLEFKPSLLLAPFVSCFWLTEPAPADQKSRLMCVPEVDRVLPNGCSDLIFEHDIYRNQYRTLYSGCYDMPFTIAYDWNFPVRKFGIRFFPGGAHSLFGISLEDFANSHSYIDSVLPFWKQELQYEILETPSIFKRIEMIEEYLLCKASQNPTQHTLINNLLYDIFSVNGITKVQELAQREAVSTRQMNRMFYQWIGTTPKKFCDIVRFQAMMEKLQSQGIYDGLSLALDYGYFDQAHMIKDFKRHYGESPLIAFRECNQ